MRHYLGPAISGNGNSARDLSTDTSRRNYFISGVTKLTSRSTSGGCFFESKSVRYILDVAEIGDIRGVPKIRDQYLGVTSACVATPMRLSHWQILRHCSEFPLRRYL